MANFPEYFLALCKDRPTEPNEFVYTMYFVNNTEEIAHHLYVKSGGYVTIDDELIYLKPSEKTFEQIPPQSYQIIETDDEGAFDYVIWFQITVTKDDRKITLDFHIPKYLAHVKTTPNIPLLNKEGFVFFPLSD